MKKFLLVLVLSCLVFSVYALDGVVVDVMGKVEKQSGDSWIALKEGDILAPGDVVSTGFKSEAVLAIGESTVTVRALTRLTIEQLYEKNKNHVSSVYLDTGSICADIKPVENKRVGFTVKTPAVTASVRGTAGYVYAYGKVEAIRGKWGLSSPLPKEINFDRGDIGESSEKPEQEGLSSVVNQQSNISSTSKVEEKVDTNASDSANEETELQQSGEIGDVTMEMEPVDTELESLIAGANANTEIFVSAGEVAYVNPVQTDVIVTPVEVKKENATNSNTDLSKFEEKVIEEFANIIIEIVVPEEGAR